MKVRAAIVTHNRCALLGRCIDHLQLQTWPADAILVINNASTDGTVEMLVSRNLSFVTQENVGSAGGWHRAIQHAIDNCYDAVWLMDDDGFPGDGALSLLRAELVPGVACASSVVLREDLPTHFVFPFPLLDKSGLPVIFGHPRKVGSLDTLAPLAQNGCYPFAHLFNGALISVAAARKVGNVNRDFFMFGDEVDYFFRLRNVGKVISVLNAVHFHPDVTKRPYTPAKVYYYVKNTLILNALYFNAPWMRNIIAIFVVIGRTANRNGILSALSYVLGPCAPAFYRAILLGLQGRIRKDFNG
jgi:rhamnopyranosyl-N-acetylglucosaminyl-diphospho-decaprenol beta-1,3/1,4-galactofuranosyltransferase